MTKAYAFVACVFLAAMIGGTWAYTQFFRKDHDCGVTAVAGATIGGPFELLDGSGTLVNDVEVIDRPSLVYFGYSFCPDVCPFDLARNAEAIDLLDKQGVEVKPVFISVDPDRDTPEVVAEYTGFMHERMVGLTGSPAQVDAAAKAYRVYYSKVPSEDEEYYLMDHSAFTYLMMPETGIKAFFRRDVLPEHMAEKTACLLGAT